MEIDSAANKQPGLQHWLFQIVPPLTILVPLLGTRNGAGLVFLIGFFVIPVLISMISILFKLLAFKKRKYFLVRPVLMIVLFVGALSITQWSYSSALVKAEEAAAVLHQQCQSDGVCPANPDGWDVDGRRISRRDLGSFYRYTASYYYQADYFEIRVYQGPDLGNVISGGVDTPLRVDRYVENQ
ncbi:MAG: hypothetical protein QNJ14_00210 [Woeseiaceae bacterium]|nr:hypothetical protein [Woeseiaceae bacterium]